jgi:hypothetical protein
LVLSPEESRNLDTYIENAKARTSDTVGGAVAPGDPEGLAPGGFSRGVRSGQTVGRLDDNRPVDPEREVHNCATWLNTAPVGPNGEALCSLMGASFDPAFARPRNWYDHLASDAPRDRVPAVIHWTQDTVEQAAKKLLSGP